MIWATVSSQSCFCWMYRASLSSAAKNIISLILVLTIWWCPRVEFSLVLLEEDVCCDQCVLLAKLCLPLPCFIPYSKAKFACYSRCSLTSYFCIPVPYNEKVGSQETPRATGKFGLGINPEWSRAKANSVLPRELTGHSKHPLPTTQQKTLHVDITRWSTLKSDWLYSLQPKMEKLYTVSNNKTGSWLWLRS